MRLGTFRQPDLVISSQNYLRSLQGVYILRICSKCSNPLQYLDRSMLAHVLNGVKSATARFQATKVPPERPAESKAETF